MQELTEAGLLDAARAIAAIGTPVAEEVPAPQGSAKFLARADAFLAALEIALPLIQARDTGYRLHLSLLHLMRLVEFIGSGDVSTIGQLRYLEDDFLTYWNEAPDSKTRALWDEARTQGLPYERVDHLEKILSRGRITSRTQYDFAVDAVVVAEQDGRLSSADAARLAEIIGVYERGIRR